MQYRVSPQALGDMSAEQWQARVDLAAAHRLAFMHGFSEGIFNHLTLVVPGRSDRYYQIPFGTHWSEVTASCFMEVGIDDGEVMVKELKRKTAKAVELKSLNSEHRDRTLPTADIVWLARIVWASQ